MENNIFTRGMFLRAMTAAQQRLDQQIGEQNQFYPIYEQKPCIERETTNLPTTTRSEFTQVNEQNDSATFQDTFETDNIMPEELHDEKPETPDITLDQTIAEDRKPGCGEATFNPQQNLVHMVSIPSGDSDNLHEGKHERFEKSIERTMPEVRKCNFEDFSHQQLDIEKSSIFTTDQNIFDEKPVISKIENKNETLQNQYAIPLQNAKNEQDINVMDSQSVRTRNQDIFNEKPVYCRESIKREFSQVHNIGNKKESQQIQYKNEIPPQNAVHNKMQNHEFLDQVKVNQSVCKEILSPNVRDSCFPDNGISKYIEYMSEYQGLTGEQSQSAQGRMLEKNIFDISMLRSALAEAFKVLKEEQLLSLKNSSTSEVIETDARFSLERFLVCILTKKDMPISVSFINLFLNQQKVEKITKEFFSRRSVQNTFSIYLLGCDLKICLKELDSNISEPSSFERDCITSFDEIIEKDITKLKDLRVRFENDGLREIKYDDFVERYSSNKYKMKLPFIVRNSHALLLYKKNENTYIRFINEEEQTPEIVDLNDSMEMLLATSLRNLLQNFTVEINQGLLNSCFNYGDIVIDSNFLFNFQKSFASTENNGVILVNNEIKCKKLKSNLTKKLSGSPSTLLDVRTESNDDSLKLLEVSVVTEDDSHGSSPLENAILKEQSVVMVGNSSRAPIRYYANMKTSEKIKSLEGIRNFIDAKIKECE